MLNGVINATNVNYEQRELLFAQLLLENRHRCDVHLVKKIAKDAHRECSTSRSSSFKMQGKPFRNMIWPRALIQPIVIRQLQRLRDNVWCAIDDNNFRSDYAGFEICRV